MQATLYYKFNEPASMKVLALLKKLPIECSLIEVDDGQVHRPDVVYISRQVFEQQFAGAALPLVKVDDENPFTGYDAQQRLLQLRRGV